MFNWFKKLVGSDYPAEPTISQADILKKPAEAKVKVVLETTPPALKSTPKAKVKKSVDLDSMKKDELLAHAKKAGVKVSASMKKADIITAIQSG